MSPMPQDVADHLPELRDALLLQRRRLFQQVAGTREDLAWLGEDVEPELVEEGQEEMLAQILASLDDHQREEIDAIEGALERMARGEYGSCEECGEPIPLERLRAVPTTTLCVEDAQEREEEARRGPPGPVQG